MENNKSQAYCWISDLSSQGLKNRNQSTILNVILRDTEVIFHLSVNGITTTIPHITALNYSALNVQESSSLQAPIGRTPVWHMLKRSLNTHSVA